MPSPLALIRACFAALIVLGIVWELWWAPLRPGGSLLVLKVLPLVIGLPAVWRGHTRAIQFWSMGLLFYVCEGAVRATSDPGISVWPAAIEAVLATTGYVFILLHMRALRVR